MRKLFAALFFTADRARGAVFALTLLTIGLFLWLSLYCAAGRRYFVSPGFALPSWLPWTFWIGALLLILYALVLGIGGRVSGGGGHRFRLHVSAAGDHHLLPVRPFRGGGVFLDFGRTLFPPGHLAR